MTVFELTSDNDPVVLLLLGLMEKALTSGDAASGWVRDDGDIAWFEGKSNKLLLNAPSFDAEPHDCDTWLLNGSDTWFMNEDMDCK